MDDVTGPDLRADAAHILASLPNPVFVLDADVDHLYIILNVQSFFFLIYF